MSKKSDVEKAIQTLRTLADGLRKEAPTYGNRVHSSLNHLEEAIAMVERGRVHREKTATMAAEKDPRKRQILRAKLHGSPDGPEPLKAQLFRRLGDSTGGSQVKGRASS